MFRRKITRFQGVNSPTLVSDAVEETPSTTARVIAVRAGSLLGNPFIVIGLFAVVYAVLGFMYYQAQSRESDHQATIEAAQSSLASQPDNPDALRNALASWTAALEAADQMRIQEKFDSALLSQLMDVADSAGVSLISAGLQSDAVAEIEDNHYLTTPIRLRANGSLAVLQDFIGQLEAGAIEALEVQSSDVTLDSSGYYAAIVNVAVFSQPDNIDELAESEDAK